MTDSRWPLGPRAARVFYNVADAWIEPSANVDWVAGLASLDARNRRRLERVLWWVEWSPRFALQSRRGFSWLPRAQRRAWLERLAGVRFERIASGVRWLREQVAVAQRAAPR